MEQRIQQAKAKLLAKQVAPSRSIASGRLLIDLASGMGTGCFLGWFIDKQLETIPLFLFILSICGTIGGWYSFYRDYMRQLKKNKKDDNA